VRGSFRGCRGCFAHEIFLNPSKIAKISPLGCVLNEKPNAQQVISFGGVFSFKNSD
jgi:hypothetical protein